MGGKKDIPHPRQPYLFNLPRPSDTALRSPDGGPLNKAPQRKTTLRDLLQQVTMTKHDLLHPNGAPKVRMTLGFWKDKTEGLWLIGALFKEKRVIARTRSTAQIKLEKAINAFHPKPRYGIGWLLRHPEHVVHEELITPQQLGQLTGIVRMKVKDAIQMKPSDAQRALKAFPESIRRQKKP